MADGQQPPLHDLVTTLSAPNSVLSGTSGTVRSGACGFYRHDRRAVSHLQFDVTDAELIPAGSRSTDSAVALFEGVIRHSDDLTADPGVTYRHTREVDGEQFRETYRIHAQRAETLTLRLRMATDLAPMTRVKGGQPTALVRPEVSRDHARWADDQGEVIMTLDHPSDDVLVDESVATWTWQLDLAAGENTEVSLTIISVNTQEVAFAPRRPDSPVTFSAPTVADGDQRRLLERSLRDLEHLQLAESGTTRDVFLAAGSPWFFTLFGRDSLIAARFLLPFSLELAAGTLRALAARQGTKVDASTEEQPGKILHEVRRAELHLEGRTQLHLPPLYYGTIDATPLWIGLLHDAWKRGLDHDVVEELLPNLRAALTWLWDFGDADGDGFLEYAGSDSGGLANQGWKDSGDGVRWASGDIATRPLALAEVQGYAYSAALKGAALLEEFGEDGAQARDWAGGLRTRFRESFWLDDEFGRYPTIALDGAKRAITGPASNMGHLLGTGIVDADEALVIAEHLTGDDLNAGYGLRTLSAATAGFNALSYHCGSIWPHDTAIAVLGLAAEGLHDQARELGEGLLRAGVEFDYRMPELFAGNDFHAGHPATAYPASCRPQAWSAAGAAAVVAYLADYS